MTDVIAIARLELLGVVRLKWVRLLAAAFALLAAAAAYSTGAANELSGADSFARTTMALVPVSLILIPLAATMLGVSGHSSDDGESFLFGQPVARTAILFGRWLGQTTALAGAILVGFGTGAMVILASSGAEGLWQYASFVGVSIGVAAIFASIGAAIAATTEKRITALAVGIFTWFFFVLLDDGIVLSLAGWLNGRAGGRILFGSIFVNPADLARVTMLRLAGTANVLGAAGEAWARFLGGDRAATAIAALALALWTAVPLAVAARLFRTRDL